jgi:hypothetical protein
MLAPDLGRAAFRVAFFLIVVSAGMMIMLDVGSAEYVVAAVTLAIGVLFGAVIAVVVRRQSH